MLLYARGMRTDTNYISTYNSKNKLKQYAENQHIFLLLIAHTEKIYFSNWMTPVREKMTYLKDSVKMLQAIFGCGTACLLEL
jgi:hypothetical protein